MRSFLVFSALCLVVVFCGYPVPEIYPTAPSYPVPKYPVPSYSVLPPPPPPASITSFSSTVVDGEVEVAADYDDAPVDIRKRAKARTAHNRQLHHRRALQPIRRFQKKAKQ